MKLSVCPLDGKRRPTQGIWSRHCARIAKAITDSRRVRRKTISLGEIGRQLEAGVLTELHQQPDVMGEGKVLISTRNCNLERLLHCLLRVKSHRRI